MQEELEKMLISANIKKDNQQESNDVTNKTHKNKLSSDSLRDKLNNSDSFQIFNSFHEENLSNTKMRKILKFIYIKILF